MNTSEVFIKSKNWAFYLFLFNTVVNTGFLVFVFITFWKTIPLLVVAVMVMVMINTLVQGIKILLRLVNNRTGIRIRDNYLEDCSSVFVTYQVNLDNIASTHIKSSMGSEFLIIKLRDKKKFMKNISFFNRFYFVMVNLQQGSPVVIPERSLTKTRIEQLQVLIQERINQLTEVQKNAFPSHHLH